MAYYYDKVQARVGELCGLKSKDLTEEQLKKVWPSKLIEFADEDDRVEKILANKMRSRSDTEIVEFLKRLSDKELNEL